MATMMKKKQEQKTLSRTQTSLAAAKKSQKTLPSLSIV